MSNASTHPNNDPDFVAAMHEVDDFLKGQPSRFLLPSPAASDAQWIRDKMPLFPHSVPVVEHEHNPDSRADLLSRIRIIKTPKPGLRVVLYDGTLVGKIAQSPYGPGWLSSSTRARIFWSQDDAALALVEDAGILA
jgi:hypothetical protein